ncbi:PD-(D/E)XK nuclease family protein [Microbacterium sp. NPDC055910]|uniref:PD-(D/E)XK nuclease family protein n=1 Tax=Microbacterium sp. NPDC055910 TaxID=3345659 RepID=UPI0035DCFA08
MALDISFLTVPLGVTTPPARPVNVYDILREGWRETRVDMTLLFFLDPNERHGLGSLVIDALLALLDGADLVGARGRTGVPFDAGSHLGSDEWELGSQVDYIDVLAVNRTSGLAVVVENKIGHKLNNPLDAYARRALSEEGVDAALVATLAPEHRVAPESQASWHSRSITYAELRAQIRSSTDLVDHLLSPVDTDQRRSLDLLQQFMEARTEGWSMTDNTVEAARIDEWRALLEEHGEAVSQFLTARSNVERTLRARIRRLEPLIDTQLKNAGLVVGWESHSGSKGVAWNAYHLPDVDWSYELKLSVKPEYPSIFIYEYRGRTYQDETVHPFSLGWSASDAEIAAEFVTQVTHLVSERRAATASEY